MSNSTQDVTERNPWHTRLLDKLKTVCRVKNHDYASDDNVFSNFEYAAKVAEPFKDPVDKVFATMIGIKLARMAELRNGKIPKNESVLDTGEDGTNYFAIWVSRIMKEIEDRIKEVKEREPRICLCGDTARCPLHGGPPNRE